MSIRPGGLLWMAIVCSSFVFANSSNTKRSSANPYGDTSYEPVIQGNLMADIGAFFMSLASSRGVEACIENPAGSMLFKYPPLLNVLEVLKVTTIVTDACCFSHLPFGKRFLKPFKLAATGTWICRMKRTCRCPGGVHERLMVIDENGSISGTHLLKASQAYTKRFAESVVNAWQAGEVSQEMLMQHTSTSRKRKAVETPPSLTMVAKKHVTNTGATTPGREWCCPSSSSASRGGGRRAKQSSQSAVGWQTPSL